LEHVEFLKPTSNKVQLLTVSMKTTEVLEREFVDVIVIQQ